MAERTLEGKVVIMTGAGRGLGRAMTLGSCNPARG